VRDVEAAGPSGSGYWGETALAVEGRMPCPIQKPVVVRDLIPNLGMNRRFLGRTSDLLKAV
jgi:hypothetical protein